jgi:hypothetical protein
VLVAGQTTERQCSVHGQLVDHLSGHAHKNRASDRADRPRRTAILGPTSQEPLTFFRAQTMAC